MRTNAAFKTARVAVVRLVPAGLPEGGEGVKVDREGAADGEHGGRVRHCVAHVKGRRVQSMNGDERLRR